MKRKLLATLVGTALLGTVSNLALAQTAKAGAISGDKVKIGVMNDMSGLYADIGGPGSLLTAQMAAQDSAARFSVSRLKYCPPITRTNPTWARPRRASGTTLKAST